MAVFKQQDWNAVLTVLLSMLVFFYVRPLRDTANFCFVSEVLLENKNKKMLYPRTQTNPPITKFRPFVNP